MTPSPYHHRPLENIYPSKVRESVLSSTIIMWDSERLLWKVLLDWRKKRNFVGKHQKIDMLVKTYGSAIYGVNALMVAVEVNVSEGVGFSLVGLPDNAVKESQHRIRSAFSESGFRVPGRQVIVNMAPANLKKEGTAYDLTIAIGILGASGILPADELPNYVIMGELALDGTLRPIRGALPIAIEARRQGLKGIILPKDNAHEAAIVNNLAVYGAENLAQVVAHLSGTKLVEPTVVDTRAEFANSLCRYEYDFADVKGQQTIKRALEIAAAGGHNAILIGPPGSGKTMLAKRMPSILPPLTLGEALETTQIHSVAGKLERESSLIAVRPFRSPHHTVSDVALVGGGTNPQPGEISLAHNGVLFLDELPEFKRTALEVLRQPMEERRVTISRAKMTIDYPASFVLVAAMNPCPCGYYNHPTIPCTCAPGAARRYMNKVSGPLMDRIDLHIEVTPVPVSQLNTMESGESSSEIRARVVAAREIQTARFSAYPSIHCNAQMSPRLMREHCALTDQCRTIMEQAMERMGLSARAYDRILKVARTIADLESSPGILPHHLQEAILYRSLDRDGWGK